MSKHLFISKSYDELEREAPETVLGYWNIFSRELEKKYSKTWVKEHPEAIAQLCDAAARDFAAASISEAIQGLAVSVKNAPSDYVSDEDDNPI